MNVEDLKPGEHTMVRGSSSYYQITRTHAGWECSCPAWTFQKKRSEERTCKHLKKLRGEGVEEDRVREAEESRRPKPKRKRRAPPSEDDPPARRGSRIVDDEGREFEF